MRMSKSPETSSNEINCRRKPGLHARKRSGFRALASSVPNQVVAAVIFGMAALGTVSEARADHTVAALLAQPGSALAKNLGDPTVCGCGGTADPAQNALAGSSINTAVGNVFVTETDFTGAPVTRLALTRYYNSLDTTQSALGAGWHSIWHRALNAVSPTMAIVTRADGREDVFTSSAGAWKADPDVTSRLSAVTSGGTCRGRQRRRPDAWPLRAPRW